MISDPAQHIHDRALVWDAHACFPLKPDADLSELQRYRDSGVHFVSLNIGMDMDSFENVIQVLARYRAYIASHPDEVVLALTVDDILRAKETGRLAIAFDLEGSDPLLGWLAIDGYGFHQAYFHTARYVGEQYQNPCSRTRKTGTALKPVDRARRRSRPKLPLEQ